MSEQPTFEQQLETFEELGLISKDHADAFAKKWSNEKRQFYNPPFVVMYQLIGGNYRHSNAPSTDKFYELDTEAIYNTGDYAWIVENISRITNGELAIENIRDFVDFEKGVAWVSFTCRDDNYKWDLEVDNDWVDEGLFEMFQSLAEKYNTRGRFTYFLGGQNVILGFCTLEELNRIREATGLDIVWAKTRAIKS